MKMRFFAVLLICLGSIHSASANEVVSAMGGARNYPFSGNLELQYKNEIPLWKGFVSPRAMVATNGTFELGVGFSPISFVEFNAASSWTSRYYKLKKFDCDQQICGGVVTRSRYGLKWVLGFPWNEGSLFWLPSFQWIRSRHSDESRPLADELEINLSKNGGEDLIQQTHLLGFKRENITWALLYRRGDFQDSKNSSTAGYLVYREQKDSIVMNYGVGQYESDLNTKELSLIFAITWQQGKSWGYF